MKYAVLFVENLTEQRREDITDKLKESFSIEHLPDFIIPMQRYTLTSSWMDEDSFRNLCADIEPGLLLIDTARFHFIMESRIIDEYVPTTLQNSFLDTQGTIVREIISIEGGYSKALVVDTIRKIIQSQSVLRSSYRKKDGVSVICEHAPLADWYIPYIDMRYAEAEHVKSFNNQLDGLKQEGDHLDGIPLLIRIVISRDTEKQHNIHIIAHHSVWDKTSTQIFKEKITNLLNPNPNMVYQDVRHSYKKYVDESRHVESPVLKDEFNDMLNLQHFIQTVQSFRDYNVGNKIQKSVVSLIKMGNNVAELYREKPWNLLMLLLRVVSRENGLISADASMIPMFVLQEDRTYMMGDYSNVLGEFLDLLPIFIDTNQNTTEWDMQGYVEKVQRIKREYHLNYIELLACIEKDLSSIIPSVLSINYQGAFDITYEDVQNLINSRVHRDTPEIFVNCYSDYLVVIYPTYERLLGNLEEILQRELDALEIELLKAPIPHFTR